ncbi:MAG: LysR family transcriptional regulator [Betaproteobacteria bacterium]|nr:LysR family transcriptional regulator [Betaproteobacteria bacterium]
MHLRDLEYFAAVAEHKNLRRAAGVLDLSQPALSKSLRRLEKSMETKLVKRTPKGVELTDVGSALLVHARRLRLLLDDVGREVADLKRGRAGHLRIGAAPPFVEFPVTPACTALMQASSKVTLSIAMGGNEVLLPALRKGELDVIVSGIPANPYENLVQERLFDDAFAVYASAGHRLVGRKRVTFADLARERWALTAPNTLAYHLLHQLFEEEGLPPPTIAMETASILPKIDLVASTDVLGFTARRLVRGAATRFRLAELRVKGLPRIRTVGVSYRREAYLSPVARGFIETLTSTARKTAAGLAQLPIE